MASNLDEYLENQVMTASPYQLHLMVVEAAVRYLNKGASAIVSGEWDLMDAALSKCRACLTEMIAGLRSEEAPEIVERTKALFVFILRKVSLGELERKPEHLDDAKRILETHRETWRELGRHFSASSLPETREAEPSIPRTLTVNAAVPAPHSRPQATGYDHDDDYASASRGLSWST